MESLIMYDETEELTREKFSRLKEATINKKEAPKDLVIGVTGYKGRLGHQLVQAGCVPLDCDVTDVVSINEAIYNVLPDVIINCAAKTSVDECETHSGYNEAIAVNFRGATNLREAFPGYLIHISTDYVFDCLNGPYSEDDDELSPVNGYGFSKFGAEAGLMSFFVGDRTTIVRTTGLYGGSSGRSDFVSMLIKSLTRGEKVKITEELFGNQTYIPHLVEALMKLAYFRNPNKLQEIIHIGSSGVISRYEFAMAVAYIFELDNSLIIPCNNSDIDGWIAKRPKSGGLKVDLAKRYGLPIYTVMNGLSDLKNKGLKYYEIRDHNPVL